MVLGGGGHFLVSGVALYTLNPKPAPPAHPPVPPRYLITHLHLASGPQKALSGGIPGAVLEPLGRSWSHFWGIYRQELTKSSKNDFLIEGSKGLAWAGGARASSENQREESATHFLIHSLTHSITHSLSNRPNEWLTVSHIQGRGHEGVGGGGRGEGRVGGRSTPSPPDRQT